MVISRIIAGVFSAGMIVGANGLFGQAYPSKPIRIITGGIGGSNDFAARIVATGLTASLGQPVIVDNRGGGIAPGEAASKAPADGYALLVTGATLWTGPLLRKTPYDPIMDFLPIAMLGIEPNILVMHPSVPARSVKELIALAKSRPGELNYSLGAIGGPTHIAAELFKVMAGVKIEGIPYKTDSQEISDLIAGYVQLTFQGGAKVGPLIKLGKLRALAVCSLQPSVLFPDLPTVAASGGLPGFESVSTAGVFAPAKTPAVIINRLNQEIVRVLNQPDVKKKFLDTGVEVIGSTPEEFSNKIKSEMARVGKVIKDAGIKAD